MYGQASVTRMVFGKIPGRSGAMGLAEATSPRALCKQTRCLQHLFLFFCFSGFSIEIKVSGEEHVVLVVLVDMQSSIGTKSDSIRVCSMKDALHALRNL